MCDSTAVRVLGSYLKGETKIVKVIALDAGITARDELRLDVFTDSDLAGCLETDAAPTAMWP